MDIIPAYFLATHGMSPQLRRVLPISSQRYKTLRNFWLKFLILEKYGLPRLTPLPVCSFKVFCIVKLPEKLTSSLKTQNCSHGSICMYSYMCVLLYEFLNKNMQNILIFSFLPQVLPDTPCSMTLLLLVSNQSVMCILVCNLHCKKGM